MCVFKIFNCQVELKKVFTTVQQIVLDKELTDDHTKEVSGFVLHRREWSTINRLRACHGRCN